MYGSVGHGSHSDSVGKKVLNHKTGAGNGKPLKYKPPGKCNFPNSRTRCY